MIPLLSSLYLYFILVILQTVVVLNFFFANNCLKCLFGFLFVRIQLYVLCGILLPSLSLYIYIYIISNQCFTESVNILVCLGTPSAF